jgi:hypothetical protein
MKNKLIAIALATLAALPAAAQGVYRCGETYSQQPCPGGTPVQAAQGPSAAEQTRAREAARRDAKIADTMEKARMKEEAKPAPAYIPPAKSEAAAAPEKPVVTKPKKPQHFTAVAPGENKAKKKKAAPKKKPAA